MNLKEKLSRLQFSNFILLTIAGFINAFGVTVFLAPVKLYDSGISGTSMLLSQISPEYMTLSIFLLIVEGLDRSKGVMIITEKPNEVAEALMKTFETGATIMPAKGGYSKIDKSLIYFIVNRFQITRMKTIVQTIDPKAYMTITEVADVFTSN